MNELPITSTFAAILALFMVPLTLQVSMRRAALGKAKGDIAAVVFGDGDDEVLRRRGRAFGNFIEYVPTCLVLLALLELQGAPAALCWTIGGAFTAGRMLHAAGMLWADSPAPRGVAMVLGTYPALLVPAAWLLAHVWA